MPVIYLKGTVGINRWESVVKTVEDDEHTHVHCDYALMHTHTHTYIC